MMKPMNNMTEIYAMQPIEPMMGTERYGLNMNEYMQDRDRLEGLLRAGNLEKYSDNVNTDDKILEEIEKIISSEEATQEEEQMIYDNVNRRDGTGITPLRIAVVRKKLEWVRRILSDPTLKLKEADSSILLYACRLRANEQVLEELLKHKEVDVNYKDKDSLTPLILAICMEKEKYFELLMKKPEIDIDVYDEWGAELLEIITRKRNVSMMRVLLNSKKITDNRKIQKYFIQWLPYARNRYEIEIFYPYISVDEKDIYGNTILTTAIAAFRKVGFSTDVIESILMNLNPNARITNNFGMNALMSAAENGDEKTWRILLKYIEDNYDETEVREIMTRRNNLGDDVLLLVLRSQINNVIILDLIKLGANPNNKNMKGEMLLIEVIKRNDLNILKPLLENELVDVNCVDYNGFTPLMHICKNMTETESAYGYNDAVRNMNKLILILELLNHPKIDINKRNNYGHNILLLTILKKYHIKYNTEETYVESYVNDNMSSFPSCYDYSMNGMTYEKKGVDPNTTIISIILNNPEVDPNIYDNNGHSALMYACENKDVGLFKLLLNNEKLDVNCKNKSGRTCLMYLIARLNNKDFTDGTYVAEIRESKQKKMLAPAIDYTLNRGERGRGSIGSEDIIGSSMLSPWNGSSESLTKSWKLPNTSRTKEVETITSASYSIFFHFFEELLKHPRMDVDIQDALGNTALMYTSMKYVPRLLELLLEKNATLDIQNCSGETALIHSVQNNVLHNTRVLLEAGAEPNMKDKMNKTMRNYATNIDVIESMIKNKEKKGWFS